MTETCLILFLLFHQYLLFIIVFTKLGQLIVIFGHDFKVALNVKKRGIIKQTTSETMSLWFLD